MAEVKNKPKYQVIDGLIMNASVSSKCLRGAIQYKPRDDDIFIVTFPKCGTTWAQHIVHNILNKGETFRSYEEIKVRSPFLEMSGPKIAEVMPRPGSIKTHLPFNLCPYSPSAKYIYIARNPRDCCVSYYHHTKMLPEYHFENGNFDDFFEIFIDGETDWGDYFDHLISWYEHRNDPNVCLLTYEEMKNDTRAAILKIARFLGPQYAEMLENDDKLMLKILDQTSVSYMKRFNKEMKHFYTSGNKDTCHGQEMPEGLKHVREYYEKHNLNMPFEVEFVRKGSTGDWKNYFSPDQSKRLIEKFDAKTKDTDIPKLWENLF
ncbi:amine sulfotransferase-like [Limulus polyphemus]|uniref:Amine sulfotransferase-like n=1 Tax=Limulus polyphemus TaxID=6850 RepID=A0ABM1B0Z2_LIMPO|nr:amine sulfotransferase-like [Limulus polyphemus]